MLSNLFSFGQNWYKVNLVDYAIIQFPDTPQINKTSSGITQIGYQKDCIFFIIDIEDLSNYGNLEVKPNELDNLYKGILIGFFENSQYHLLSQNNFDYQNLRGVEVEYSCDSKDFPSSRYKRLLFFNGKIFSIEFWTNLSKDKSKKERNKFFNSFNITLDKSILKQYTSSE